MKQAKAEAVGDRAQGCTLCIVVDAAGKDIAGYLGERALELAHKHADHLNFVASAELTDSINKQRKEMGRGRVLQSNTGRVWRFG